MNALLGDYGSDSDEEGAEASAKEKKTDKPKTFTLPQGVSVEVGAASLLCRLGVCFRKEPG